MTKFLFIKLIVDIIGFIISAVLTIVFALNSQRSPMIIWGLVGIAFFESIIVDIVFYFAAKKRF